MSQWLMNLLSQPQIIGYRKNGCPIWSVAGGSVNDPGDGGADDDDNDDGDESDADEAEEEDDKDSAEDKDDKDTKDDKRKPKRSADAERQERERQDRDRKTKAKIANADRRAAEAERKFKELKATVDADKPEVDRVKAELADSEGEVTRLRGVVRDQALQLAFFRNSTVDWVEPGDAVVIAMRDLADLEVDDDGTLDDEAVKSVITTLAKTKPHLVKRKLEKSGTSVTGGKGKDNGTTGLDRDLVNRFPAVRTRQRGTPPTR